MHLILSDVNKYNFICFHPHLHCQLFNQRLYGMITGNAISPGSPAIGAADKGINFK